MMRLHFTLLICVFSISFSFSQSGTEYQYFIDLTKVNNDEIEVKLVPPTINENEATFMFPSIIPGTYAVYDFGRFIKNFKIAGKNGTDISFSKLDDNSYVIKDPSQ